jgi:uncharacterized protein (TIGR02996 family)
VNDDAGTTAKWLRDNATVLSDVSKEQRFLLELQHHPEDLAMRMVFADWLEERGQPAKALVVRLLGDPPKPDTHEAMQLQVASSHLDADWLAAVTRTEIENCEHAYVEPGPKFRFRCPLAWEGLSSTQDPSVRHCDSCKRPVFFCANLAEVRSHAEARNCVAFSPTLVKSEALRAVTHPHGDDMWMGEVAEFPDDVTEPTR